jgi:flagellar protein FliS
MLHGAARARFTSDRLETASNAQIVVLCFDRLDRDLETARDAIEREDHFTANDSLHHAQDLLGELALMVDQEAWEHAGALVAVYDYLLRLLAAANIHKSIALVAEAQHLISEIGDGFRGAARDVASNASGASPSGPAADPSAASSESSSWSVRA